MPHISKVVLGLALCVAILFGTAHGVRADETRLVVALDPGHGGADPGAEAMGLNEAELTLAFADRLKTLLEETGLFTVVLTRTDDSHVPLDARLTKARSGRADLFISLHADALPPESGQATGLTLYTLDESDFARADARLIERHGGDDVLSGVDLSDSPDDVARALMTLARQENLPRSRALARSLLATFAAGDVSVNNRPHRHGGFAVLKAADMPSVLIELGFLSNAKDRKKLLSDAWLNDAALAIRDGLQLWASEDVVFRAQTLQ